MATLQSFAFTLGESGNMFPMEILVILGVLKRILVQHTEINTEQKG